MTCKIVSEKYYRKYGNFYEKMLGKLASKKTEYYVCVVIGEIRGKQRDPTP